MHRRTIKLMTMQKTLHPRNDDDRIVSTKKEEEDLPALNTLIPRREDSIEKHGGKLITATRRNTEETRINRT